VVDCGGVWWRELEWWRELDCGGVRVSEGEVINIHTNEDE
jgi:hypothetical protein